MISHDAAVIRRALLVGKRGPAEGVALADQVGAVGAGEVGFGEVAVVGIVVYGRVDGGRVVSVVGGPGPFMPVVEGPDPGTVRRLGALGESVCGVLPGGGEPGAVGVEDGSGELPERVVRVVGGLPVVGGAPGEAAVVVEGDAVGGDPPVRVVVPLCLLDGQPGGIERMGVGDFPVERVEVFFGGPSRRDLHGDAAAVPVESGLGVVAGGVVDAFGDLGVVVDVIVGFLVGGPSALIVLVDRLFGQGIGAAFVIEGLPEPLGADDPAGDLRVLDLGGRLVEVERIIGGHLPGIRDPVGDPMAADLRVEVASGGQGGPAGRHGGGLNVAMDVVVVVLLLARWPGGGDGPVGGVEVPPGGDGEALLGAADLRVLVRLGDGPVEHIHLLDAELVSAVDVGLGFDGLEQTEVDLLDVLEGGDEAVLPTAVGLDPSLGVVCVGELSGGCVGGGEELIVVVVGPGAGAHLGAVGASRGDGVDSSAGLV